MAEAARTSAENGAAADAAPDVQQDATKSRRSKRKPRAAREVAGHSWPTNPGGLADQPSWKPKGVKEDAGTAATTSGGCDTPGPDAPSKPEKERKSKQVNSMDSVVKVFAAIAEPNYALPWANKPQDAKTGTAFAIPHGNSEEGWLLTNAHVVRYAAVVQVRKRGDHQKYIARILCIGLECDLALLTVDDPFFWHSLPAVELKKELPDLQDEVTVVGFPIGGDNTCVTVGVVSRIDMQNYSSCGSKNLLAIQIDAAINPGNSGGPCFRASSSGHVQCIGVAFQVLGRDDAENIGYIIPAEVVEHFLTDYSQAGEYTGFGTCGFSSQPLENAAMRFALGLRKNQSGALVRRVNPAAPSSKVLRKGDIILWVDGLEVGNDGKVLFRGTQNERIDLSYVVSRKFIGETCKLTILSNRKVKTVSLELAQLKPLVPRDPPVPPPYFIVGGLVFVCLSEPFLWHEYGDQFEKEAPISLMWYWAEGMRKFEGHEIVVLSQVLASPLTVGFTDFYDIVLSKFNGQEPRNLKHFVDMVDNCNDEYLTFDLEHENSIVLPRHKAQQQTPAILKENMVPHDRSVQYRT